MSRLEAALEEFTRRGMCKELLFGPGDTVCAMGALFAAYGATSSNTLRCIGDSGLNTDLAFLESVVPDGYESVPDFNNAPETSEEDVKLLFKRAIEFRDSLDLTAS